MLETGVLLQNRYRIRSHIGGGGMGVVYVADDMRLAGRQCAVKEMSPEQLAPGDRNWAIQAFRQEAQMLANLHHPGLTNVTDFFAENGKWYLVMEYIHGETLESRLTHAPGGRFALEEALGIIRQLCEVLDYLHRQQPPVVFRDLKPGNVMLDEKGQVKLIDFGIARFFKANRTQDTVNLGTPGYAAPEQYGGMGQTDPRSDIYSLGVLLHQMLTGYNPTNAITPFPLPDPRTLVAQLPPHIVDVLGHAVQLQPHLRYGTVREFARDLMPAQSVMGGHPGYVTAPSPPAATRRSGIWIGLLLSVLVIVALGGIFWGVQALRRRGEDTPTAKLIANAITVTHTPTRETPAVKTDVTATQEGVTTDTPTPTPTPERGARERALLRSLRYRAENGSPIFAYRVEQPPTLDGQLLEWQGERALTPYLVYTAEDGDWSGSSDLNGGFTVAWDDDFLYLGVEVVDDLLVQVETGAKLYLSDSLEIQVDTDLNGDFTFDELNDDDVQIGFSPGDWGTRRPEAYIWQPPALEQPGTMIRVAAQTTRQGYALEAAIPWYLLGGRPPTETAVGFCLNLSDNDTFGAAEQETMFSTSAARKRGDPTTWGT
ncbi:MAG: protein kinase, partial [Anaerolineae bacterium]|nr:protein kinase [Anaerolineae bacterium]